MRGGDLTVGTSLTVWVGDKDSDTLEALNGGRPVIVAQNTEGYLALVDEDGNWVADVEYETDNE